jgi:hypothetical protein
MSDLESHMNISLTTESELFQALHKLSTDNFTDFPSQVQYQMISFGLFNTIKYNFGSAALNK